MDKYQRKRFLAMVIKHAMAQAKRAEVVGLDPTSVPYKDLEWWISEREISRDHGIKDEIRPAREPNLEYT